MISLQAALAAMALSGAGETVFLDFYADWCAPCRAMHPTVDALAQQGYPVRKVNVDQNRELAAKHNVGQIPCFVMLVDGREVDRVVGGTTFSRLERMCKLAAGPRQSEPAQVPAAVPRAGPGMTVSIPSIESRPPFSAAAPAAVPAAFAAAAPAKAAPAARQLAAPAARQLAAPGWAPSSAPPAASDDRFVSATVRLRVKDTVGQSCGSGTIIDARKGQALILTCGHIFRDSRGRGPIEVDLFGPGAQQQVPGRLISYNLERDIALVCIDAPGPLPAARVAPAGYKVGQGDAVVTVGCNHGNPPSTVHSRVTSLDKYLGPPNIQVAGQSVEGRSGGGLFSSDGMVIGVCNAADPQDNEAFYAALGAVHAELDRAKLAYIYNRPPQQQPAGQAPRAALVAVDPPPMPKQMPAHDTPPAQIEPAAQVAAVRAENPPRLSIAEQAALDEIRRRLREGAEVICVVRSRRNPLAKSEVIMLDKASPDFLKLLAAEAGTQNSHELVPTQTRQPAGTANRWQPQAARPQ